MLKMDEHYSLITLLQEKINTLQDENQKLEEKLEEKLKILRENDNFKEKIDYLIYENNQKTKEIDSCKTAINLFKQLVKYI